MNAAAASHAAGGTGWVDVLITYWWVFLIFGGGLLEWIGETFDIGLSALHRRSRLRHKRQMALKRMELEIAQAKSGAASSLPKPGPCVHRNVRPVIAAGEDEPCAWLCRCGERLPANWAVYEEDL